MDNLDLSLEGIAQAGLTCIEEVRGTITALEAAGQVAVIVRNKHRPILLALNQRRKKIYLIDQMLPLSGNLLRWGFQLPEIAECTRQALFIDPYQRNVALAQLALGASLNVQGLMLELFIPGDNLSDVNCVKVIDQDNVNHGSIEIVKMNKIILDLPTTIQEKALEVFQSLWLRSPSGTASFHNLLIHDAYREELLRI